MPFGEYSLQIDVHIMFGIVNLSIITYRNK
jgi:hypothetical protein